MDRIPPGTLNEMLINHRNTVPRVWYATFQGCIDAGFNQTQAFALTQTYILAQNSYGIRPPDAVDPNKENE